MDASTIECINGYCPGKDQGCQFDAYKAILIHTQLDAVVSTDQQLEVQKADLAITRLFLHTKVWQVSVSHSILAFGTPFVELQPEYPLVMLVKAIEAVREYDSDALRGNGKCLVRSLHCEHKADESGEKIDVYR